MPHHRAARFCAYVCSHYRCIQVLFDTGNFQSLICLHCLQPLHVCACQSSTQALSGVDNKCTFTPLSLCLSTKASMVTYVHVRICAFDPSTNASIHVNRQHNALSTITCVHTCQHRLQPKSSPCTSTKTCTSMHIYNKSLCLACMSTKA